MDRYELICFSLHPGLSPQRAQELAGAVLENPPLPRPGARLAILPLEAVRSKQRLLTRAGIVCNYRPTADPPDLQLATPTHILSCPRCGAAATIPEGRRNYRCPQCHHPILRHGREVPFSPPTQTTAKPARRNSHAVTLLLGAALFILLDGGELDTLTQRGKGLWRRALAPLTAEFQLLTQAMALHRLRQPIPTDTDSEPVAHRDIRGESPTESRQPEAGIPANGPVQPGDTRPSPTLTVGIDHSTAATPPAPLPRLPQTLREADNLTKLETQLREQLAHTAKTPGVNTNMTDLPADLPPVPQPAVPLSPKQLRSAIRQLDQHLADTTPFLRQIYRHDLEQLRQMENLIPPFTSETATHHPKQRNTATNDHPVRALVPNFSIKRAQEPAFCPSELSRPPYCPAA